MENNNVIEIRDMYKSFKTQNDSVHSLKDFLVRKNKRGSSRHEVLKGINLDIKKGETVALIGTNGSGKSTLLKLMTKIIYPTKGTIKTYGKLTSMLELGAGFHPDFTGRENIYFNAAIFGLTEKEIDERIADIIDFSELGTAIDEPIRTYSSGMYLRLAFSVAINVDAEILLIDEILAVGDQHFQEKCFGKLKELRDNENKTIVIVSHGLDVVKDLCNRAIWLYDGNFKMDGDPDEVVAAYLAQVAADNIERNKKAIENGAGYSGEVTIDAPHEFDRYDKDEIINVTGWRITNSPDAELVVSVSDKNFSYINKPRKDVYRAFHEQYAGFMDENEVGFSCDIIASEVLDKMDEDGTILIKASLVQKDGTILKEKEVKIIIDREDA